MAADTIASLAVERVFSINELLEEIILELPVLDILITAYRVSKHWNHAIEASLKIQQKLWFLPKDGYIASPTVCHLHYTLPLYEEKLVQNPTLESDESSAAWPKEYLMGDLPLDATGHSPARVALWRRLQFANFMLPPGARVPSASWRRMLITSPPCSIVEIDCQWYGDRRTGTRICKFVLRVPDGIRFGHLEDLAVNVYSNAREYHEDDSKTKWMDVSINLEMTNAAYDESHPPSEVNANGA